MSTRGMRRATARVLPRAFYARPTLEVLPELIGKVLVRDHPDGVTAGIIVEAEAYIGESDPACHAAPGPTARNAPLYGPPGFAYVYLNYGIHELVNAVTEPEGSPAAILIRALDPLDGLELMRARRAARRPQDAPPVRDVELCRGPGNLTVAMAIDRTLNCADLTGGPMWIEDRGIMPADLSYSARIGIRVGVDRPWRCTWAGHPAVSGRVR
ncbi:MAG: DNA-3-methyladenine glycosylase [Acidobacteriota bacterium]|jgi:DNA-3-methyladenine glycosylase